MELLMQTKRSKRLWKGFWQLADPKIWIASTVPMLVGAVLAYAHTKQFDPFWFGVALVGIYLIEIGKNAVNEWIDYYTGVDRSITPDKRNPFSGGKKTIVDGKLSMAETAGIAAITLGLAFIIGLIVALAKEPGIFWIGMAGGMLAVFYSLPPFKLNYIGLGELAVGVAFGPLLVSGMYVLMAGVLTWDVIAVGMPIGFLIANVLWINQYPDYEADKSCGKRNGLVRIGKVAGLKVYAALYAAVYVSLGGLAVLYGNPFWLLGILTLPLAVESLRVAKQHMEDTQKFLTANQRTIQIYMLLGIAMIAAPLLNLLFL